MNKISSLIALLVLIFLVPALIYGQPGTTVNKPNIVVITTDQQFADAISFMMGREWIHTPNLDRLAANGVVFNRAYSANPLCAPSRNSLITGQYPHTTGIQSNDQQNELYAQNAYFDGSDFKAMGTYFKEAGYETAYFGKWHINYDTADKRATGFDLIKYATGRGNDDSLPSLTKQFITRERTNPYFLFLSFLNPHDVCEWSRYQVLKNGDIGPVPPADLLPLVPDNFYPAENESEAMQLIRESYHKNLRLFPVGNYTQDEWRRLRWGYFRLIEKVDSLIGQTLDYIEENNKDNNTLILFTSDHGSAIGSHHVVQKTFFFDESTRIPFILNYGGHLKSGINQSLVNMGVDMLPTLLDFAGIDRPESLPGKSLRSAAATGAIDADPFIVVQNRMTQGGEVNGTIPVVNGRMVRDNRYKYNLYDLGDRREELYDMNTDRLEMKNIAYDNSSKEIIKKMRSYLKDFATKYNDTVALEMLKQAD